MNSGEERNRVVDEALPYAGSPSKIRSGFVQS